MGSGWPFPCSGQPLPAAWSHSSLLPKPQPRRSSRRRHRGPPRFPNNRDTACFRALQATFPRKPSVPTVCFEVFPFPIAAFEANSTSPPPALPFSERGRRYPGKLFLTSPCPFSPKSRGPSPWLGHPVTFHLDPSSQGPHWALAASSALPGSRCPIEYMHGPSSLHAPYPHHQGRAE